ncbi:SHOCT domain-containing protein [Ruminococcus flavefaciens]|uniref:SHOCT domain-containing protein n=1 Tax=Ruminococcus flavefaciens TaxID=1265 RepID=UPI003EFCEC42
MDIGYWIGVAIWSVVWGVVTSHMSRKKGYGSLSGFFWGFFLGIIGVIIIAFKEDKNNPFMDREAIEKDNERFFKEHDGWECPCCARLHGPFERSCICGFSLNEEKVIEEGEIIKENIVKTAENEAEIIAKYKKMCDDGLITEDEFKEKKKQILGL